MAGSARRKHEHHLRMAERYGRGADGEDATAAVLATLPEPWVVMHDLAWPGRRFANIDHIAVGSTGVFVIDSKNWSGRITVDDCVLRQNGRSRANTVHAAQEAGAAVASLLVAVSHEQVVPVICFTDAGAPDASLPDALVCSTNTLVALLTERPPVFPDRGVWAVADELRRCLPAATAPREAGGAATTVPARRSKSGPVTRPRRKRRPTGLASALVGAVAAVVLLTNPGAFTALTDGFSGLLVDQMSPTVDDPVKPKPKQEQKKQSPERQGDKQERQGQR